MTNRRQAIIWTNDGFLYWRIYVLLGFNELPHWGTITNDIFKCIFFQQTVCIFIRMRLFLKNLSENKSVLVQVMAWLRPRALNGREAIVWIQYDPVLLRMNASPGFNGYTPRNPDINTLRPRQNSLRLPDDIFKWIFLNENVWISIEIPLKFVPTGPINNIPALVQIMAWRRSGDKPLSEPMVVCFLTHMGVTRP